MIHSGAQAVTMAVQRAATPAYLFFFFFSFCSFKCWWPHQLDIGLDLCWVRVLALLQLLGHSAQVHGLQQPQLK